MQVILADLGGTYIRFAMANISQGKVLSVDNLRTMRVADYASFQEAWRDYKMQTGATQARAAALAIAGPAGQASFKLTNNAWELRASEIVEELEIDDLFIVNDFEAVGHAVANAGPAELVHICGPDRDLSGDEVISVIGPGTGLGVAQVINRNGSYHVTASEGGHADFAPVDAFDDFLLHRLREQYGRVSVERIVSGSGLKAIYEALAAREGQEASISDTNAVWSAAISGEDPLTASALDCFCRIFGSAAGNIALIHGATAVVLSGGVSLRMAAALRRPGFFERLQMKGRLARVMADIPVRLITDPEPGIAGAAAAFARISHLGPDAQQRHLRLV